MFLRYKEDLLALRTQLNWRDENKKQTNKEALI